MRFPGTKLAGAFGSTLRDAISGLDAADTRNLATAEWRNATRDETTSILEKIHERIAEVRAILNDTEFP